MSKVRPSIFRDALQVAPERLAAMDDADLNILILQLLRAQAYRCGSPIDEVRVNTEGRAKDDGGDGWSARPSTPDQWLDNADTAIGIPWHRMKSKVEETERWKPLALELVTSSELIRSRQMTSHYWTEVARALVPDQSDEIAAAILREQAGRDAGTWFAEQSNAASMLRQCVGQRPVGLWQALKLHLSSPAAACRFISGFPKGVIERMPPADVAAWIAEKPEERAAIMLRLINKDLSSDETLASQFLWRVR